MKMFLLRRDVSPFLKTINCIVRVAITWRSANTINLTGSRSNLTFDWNQQPGNPADIDHLRKIPDSFSFCPKISPRDIATDVACASKANLFSAKAPGIIEVDFNRGRDKMQNVSTRKRWRP